MNATDRRPRGATPRGRRRLGLALLVSMLGVVAAACFPPAPPAAANLSQITGGSTITDSFPLLGGTDSTYTITNTGGLTTGPLTGSIDNFTGTGAWVIIGGTCGFNAGPHPGLAPNASCTILLRYTVTSASDTGSTDLTVTGAPGGTRIRTIQGAGVIASELVFSPTSVSFSDSNTPGPAAVDVTLQNGGNAPTAVNLSITNAAGDGVFSLNPGSCGAGLGLGGTCTVHLFYENNTATGSGSATLVATGDNGPTTMALTGTGTGTANVLVGPASASVNDPVGGGVSTVQITITNTGSVTTGPLTSIFSNGTGTGNVSRVSDTCQGVQLLAGASCTVNVDYEALNPGDAATVDLEVSGVPGGFESVPITATSS